MAYSKGIYTWWFNIVPYPWQTDADDSLKTLLCAIHCIHKHKLVPHKWRALRMTVWLTHISIRYNLLVLVQLLVLQYTTCYRYYQDQIPNGDQVPHPCKPNFIWRGVGHLSALGGGDNNQFGLDFANNGHKVDTHYSLTPWAFLVRIGPQQPLRVAWGYVTVRMARFGDLIIACHHIPSLWIIAWNINTCSVFDYLHAALAQNELCRVWRLTRSTFSFVKQSFASFQNWGGRVA